MALRGGHGGNEGPVARSLSAAKVCPAVTCQQLQLPVRAASCSSTSTCSPAWLGCCAAPSLHQRSRYPTAGYCGTVMAGGEFYTVLMQQTNKALPRRLQLGRMKEKQKVKAITRYKQREVRGCCSLREQS